MDLVFMQPRMYGFSPCVSLIHINCKVAVVVPVKSKSASSVSEGVRKAVTMMRDDYGQIVNQITVDAGGEFKGATKTVLNDMGVELHVSRPQEGHKTRIDVVERFHRTLRKIIQIWKDEYDTNDWYDMIPRFLYIYNYVKVHRSIGKTPMEMTKMNERSVMREQAKKTETLKKKYTKEMLKNIERGKHSVRHHNVSGKDEFYKKDGARYSRHKYSVSANPQGERSLVLTNADNPNSKPLKRRYIPYDVLWVD